MTKLVFYYSFMLSLVIISVSFISCNTTQKTNSPMALRENGWYHVLGTDSLSSKPIVAVKDFTGLKLVQDYYGKYVGCSVDCS